MKEEHVSPFIIKSQPQKEYRMVLVYDDSIHIKKWKKVCQVIIGFSANETSTKTGRQLKVTRKNIANEINLIYVKMVNNNITHKLHFIWNHGL